MKDFFANLRDEILINLISFFHFLLRSTWRLKKHPYPESIQKRLDESKPVVFGHLHQDDLTLIAFYVGQRVGVMVSKSKDGGLLARFFKKINFVVARGSSSRSAASGFLELLRLTKEESLQKITFAIDGPRGPLGKTKLGIFKLAEILEAPIVPVVALADRRWIFRKSWSKHFLPKPFANVEAIYLEPISEKEVTEAALAKDFKNLAELFDKRIAEAKGPQYF